MPRLTEALIRKRAEHNDGILPDLEELALHQQELEGIDSLESCCRHLKILLLQNNIIPKMEGLNKLKELEYLNLALNNISLIEGLEGCESLKKLDLTVNFVSPVELRQSVYNLKANVMLEDLYLTGNPCEDWSGHRFYILAHLPQLKQFDGKLVLPNERIKARQQLPELEQDLDLAAEAFEAKRAAEAGLPVSEGAYTKESRVEMYLELAEQKEEKERNERRRMGTETKPAREIPGVRNARGELRQCNEGKYDFVLEEQSSQIVLFELGVPRYLETSALDVDVDVNYVRVVVKGKVTQLKLPAEVRPDAAKVTRARTTGALRVEMPLAFPKEAAARKPAAEPELQPLEPEKPRAPQRQPAGPPGAAVSIKGIYQDPRRVAGPTELLREVRTTRTGAEEDAEEDDDVPPLLARGG